MKINTVDAKTYGFVLSDPPGWLDAPTFQTPTAVVPGFGTLATGPKAPQPRRLTLRGHVRGSTAAAARDNLDLFKMALSAGPANITLDDRATRYYGCNLESVVVPPASSGAFLTKDIPTTATLIALDPYGYDITATPAVGRAMPLGTAPVRPVLSWTLVVSSPPFVVELTDYLGAIVASLSIDSTFAGDTLVINNQTQTITKNGSSIIDLATGDFFVVDPLIHANYAGALWPTIQNHGEASGGTPSITYRRAWL